MADFEILCVTMHQKDFSKIKEMNIHADVVFANQCDRTAYEELELEGHTAKMISTQTRGVGVNRNLTLTYASAKYCMLADDDVVYVDDLEQKVVSEFEAHPDADVMIFHLDSDTPSRAQEKYPSTKKWPRYKGVPWGCFRVAVRLSSVRKANVWFTTLFGGGCLFPSGEDSKFLLDLRKAGLKIYVSKETIGNVSFSTSTWFTGYDEKYYYGKGAFYQAVRPRFKFFWRTYFVLRTYAHREIKFFDKLKWMKYGAQGYKKMMPYGEFVSTLKPSEKE